MAKILLLLLFLIFAGCSHTVTRGTGGNTEVKSMDLVGFNDLQARSAYQPVIHHQGNRFVAYIGHHGGSALNPLTDKIEPNGTSIVDVTDPRKPKYLGHFPGSLPAQVKPAARKWCVSATAGICPRVIRKKLTCSGALAMKPTT
jgi:hypothetical protein